MSKNRTTRLVVELLEDRNLMSGSGLIANPDGPIATFKNSPITVNVLANDTNQNGGTLSVVNLTQDPKGVATVNPDNSVTFSPFTDMEGSVALAYVVTNGQDTASASIYIDIFKTPSELYSEYLTGVSQADQVYTSAMQAASDARHFTLDAAQASAEFATEQLWQTYHSAASAAHQIYLTAHSALLASEANAVGQADATATPRDDAALNAFLNALTSAEGALAQSVQSSNALYDQATQSADNDYQAALAPYQAAVDAAQANAQANPNDPNAQAALTQAQQDFANAQSLATGVRDSALASALSAKQTAYASAVSVYQGTVSSASSTAQIEIDAAEQDFVVAAQSAQTSAQTAENAAQAAYVQSESSAWSVYQSGLASIQMQLQTDSATIQSLYDASVNASLAVWQASENGAWTTYTSSLLNLPNAPVPDARQIGPMLGALVAHPARPLYEPPPRLLTPFDEELANIQRQLTANAAEFNRLLATGNRINLLLTALAARNVDPNVAAALAGLFPFTTMGLDTLESRLRDMRDANIAATRANIDDFTRLNARRLQLDNLAFEYLRRTRPMGPGIELLPPIPD